MCEADPASASTGEEGPSDACPPRVRELLLRPRRHEGAYDRSVFTVDAFASAEECEALVFAAHRLLDSYGTRDVQPARSRLSIVSQVDKVLRLRLLALIEAELPAYADAAGWKSKVPSCHSLLPQPPGTLCFGPEAFRARGPSGSRGCCRQPVPASICQPGCGTLAAVTLAGGSTLALPWVRVRVRVRVRVCQP